MNKSTMAEFKHSLSYEIFDPVFECDLFIYFILFPYIPFRYIPWKWKTSHSMWWY